MAEKHDWEAAKAFYISGGWRQGVTLQLTAERFRIPYQPLRRRAAKERWRLIREWKEIDPDLKTVDEYVHYYKCYKRNKT